MNGTMVCPQCAGTSVVSVAQEGCFTGGYDEDGNPVGWYEYEDEPCPLCKAETDDRSVEKP